MTSLRVCLKVQVNDTEFSLLEIREKYDLETTQGKIDFVRDSLKIIATLQPVEQEFIFNTYIE